MIQIIWPTGELTTGNTFEEIERALRASQWHTYPTLRKFRKEMCRRAELWSGIMVPTPKTSEEFIRSLHQANLFMMFNDEEDDVCTTS